MMKILSNYSEINIDELLMEFKNIKKAPKNHIICDCPYCFKPNHFYFSKTTRNWDCKKCGENGNLFKLLVHMGKLSLLKGKTIQFDEKLPIINIEQEMGELDIDNVDLVSIKMPIGFRRQFQNDYLDSRNFTKLDYNKYIAGETRLLTKFNDYVLLGITQNELIRGYIGRNKKSKEELNEIESKLNYKVPRYLNSKNNQFSKILLGYDEINIATETVILVEGFFDKRTVDQRLGLNFDPKIKCCATFGKKISDNQILLLLSRGIKKVIIAYDPDAYHEIKKSAIKISRYIDCLIVFTEEGDVDEITDDQFINMFSRLLKPIDFACSIIKKINI